MPTVGLEYRYPFISVQSWGTQTIEPIAQIIARPNETQIGRWPNEDAQSFDLRRQQPVPRQQVLRLGPRRRRRPRQLRRAIHRAVQSRRLRQRPVRPVLPAVRAELLRGRRTPTNTGLDSGLDNTRVRLRRARRLPAELDISPSPRASASTKTTSTCSAWSSRPRANFDRWNVIAAVRRLRGAARDRLPRPPPGRARHRQRSSSTPTGSARRRRATTSRPSKFDQTPASASAISTIASSWR